MTCPKSPYYEIDNAYAYGFDDARQKAVDILTRYIHGTFKVNEELLYKIRKELEKM